MLCLFQVHPTSRRDREPFLTNEHYEFAGQIVGKCLFDTAIGRCPLFVNACFTRSFLAQIIGSRVTWEVREVGQICIHVCNQL